MYDLAIKSCFLFNAYGHTLFKNKMDPALLVYTISESSATNKVFYSAIFTAILNMKPASNNC